MGINLFSLALGAVVLAIKLYTDSYEKEDLALTLVELKNDSGLPRIKTYDFIIVGGGGAGCVLANRLSRYHGVLLLEAGGDPVPMNQAFVHYEEVIFNPQINFLFKALPKNLSYHHMDRIKVEPAGRMLGGSTFYNGIIFNRGHPSDFDKWAEVSKDSSWKYENILKYYEKLEKFIGDQGHRENKSSNFQNTSIPLLSYFGKAVSELRNQGAYWKGSVVEPVSDKKGKRVNTFTAYIENIERKRKKLKIERYSTVSKILFNKGRKAYGVLYTRHGLPQIAHASNEIILSAGVIGTPLLLMKSGIGPSKILEDAGISVVHSLPVGIGIQEYPFLSFPPISVNENWTELLNPKMNLTEGALRKFQEEGKGPLADSLEGQAYTVISPVSGKQETLSLEHTGNTGSPIHVAGGIRTDLLLEIRQPLHYSVKNKTLHFYSLATTLLRPKARGVLTLNATAYKKGIRNAEGLAILDLQLLTDPSDVKALIAGVKSWFSIFGTTAFKKIDMGDMHLLDCGANLKHYFDAHLDCLVKAYYEIRFHLTSGCRIGSGTNDTGGVLDSKMNVLGVKGLKVVDASVMPTGPSTNPTATVIMIAEKASAEILSAWKSTGKKKV